MNVMFLICAINYWLVKVLRNVPYTVGNEVEMDEKYTPYNHKGTKVDGVEPKHRGTLLQKEACLISRYVLSL